MAIIGTFAKNENGFTGTIKTLCLDVNAKLVPTPKDNEKGPDFRVLVGHIEFGAGWKQTSKNGHFVSLCLDDPNFGAAIYANLVEANDSNYILIWSRRSVDDRFDGAGREQRPRRVLGRVSGELETSALADI